MSMVEGRLVWSRDRPKTGKARDTFWRAPSHVTDTSWYVIEPVGKGRWIVSVLTKEGPRNCQVTDSELGEVRYLRDAKRLADEHHHKQAAIAGPAHVREYLARYPLDPPPVPAGTEPKTVEIAGVETRVELTEDRKALEIRFSAPVSSMRYTPEQVAQLVALILQRMKDLQP